MHSTLKLIVRDKAGVWIDARKSSGGVPFDELSSVDGFPQELTYEQEVTIPVIGFTEIIYIRDCKTFLDKIELCSKVVA
jgi:hypothetical protein